MHRITRFVFWLDGAVVSTTPDQQLLPGMADLLDAVQHRFELWLVSNYPPQQTAVIIEKNGLSTWFADTAVYALSEQPADHQALLQRLVDAGVITPASSLWIDPDPVRTMLAIRQGIDAGIFVDSARLYRDFGLWGFV